MRYDIAGTVMQTVTIELAEKEGLFANTGSMSWMTPNIRMETTAKGGIWEGIKRSFAGGSLFLATFTGAGPGAKVTFAGDLPGKVVPMELAQGEARICQKEAFLAAQESVTFDIFFQKRLGAGLVGGEGFILQRLTGPGTAFVAIDGELVEVSLAKGEGLLVDTGHVGMFEPTIDFDIQVMKGFKNIIFGGEGIFLASLKGPGKVWLQTLPAGRLAARLRHYLPTAGGSHESGNSLTDIFQRT